MRKARELQDTTVQLMTQYYNNKIEPFLEVIDEHILWVGPAEGQIIYGKETLVDTFSKEHHQLTFQVYDLCASIALSTRKCVEIFLHFSVDTFYPDGKIIRCDQRILFSWIEHNFKDNQKKKHSFWRIKTCFISNGFPYSKKDTIYPVHFTETPITKFMTPNLAERHIKLKGLNHEVLFLIDKNIIRIYSRGNHTWIYTTDRCFESITPIRDIERDYSDILFRCHASHMINPIYVKSITRFKITLLDDTEVPVPEKKYTQIKQKLSDILLHLNT
ncbi:MAG: LytTR family transcriptional regulator [Lachnospiraceae bacterium]|jgi:hypothetical protein|nr:LytTR family transcriptional regulator [Lachnospiraceae bacterium]